MSVYYSYLVQTDDPEALEIMLSDISQNYPIDEHEIEIKYDLADDRNCLKKVIDKIFGVSFSRARFDKGIRYSKALSDSEIVATSTSAVRIYASLCENIAGTIQTNDGWRKITTSIDHADGLGKDKIDFARQLQLVCSHVYWKSECDGDDYPQCYIDVSYE